MILRSDFGFVFTASWIRAECCVAPLRPPLELVANGLRKKDATRFIEGEFILHIEILNGSSESHTFASKSARGSGSALRCGFWAEHTLEARAYELYADDALAIGFRWAYMHDAALRLKVAFVTPHSRALQWYADLQAGANGHIKARAKCGSTAA